MPEKSFEPTYQDSVSIPERAVTTINTGVTVVTAPRCLHTDNNRVQVYSRWGDGMRYRSTTIDFAAAYYFKDGRQKSSTMSFTDMAKSPDISGP